LAYLVIVVIVLAAGARSRTPDEVPTGFYNLFEMIIEFAYNFARGIVGVKVRDFFPWFMTFLLLILIANWFELVPFVDSFGIWENAAHFQAEQEVEDLAAEEALTPEEEEALVHDLELQYDEANVGDLRVPAGAPLGLLIRAEGNVEGDSGPLGLAVDPERADWTIVPFFRAPSTDINFTLAVSLVSMIMVQYYAFKYLGLGYLSKFFTLPIEAIKRSPMRILDPAVGILEFISEVSKIISFNFRLLGNIFAGQVLLFVMAALAPVANVAFFGLEFFVGLIQAFVFGMLTIVFMNGATEGHGSGDEEHH
jgi:F-type H+-transporting ATPase subunit a